MNISPKGIVLIKGFEGCVLKPYRDSAGIPTIGYGCTRYENGKKVQMTDPPITQARADMLLLNMLVGFNDAVNKLVKVPITQNQHDALVSFDFNTGALAASSALANLNKGNVLAAADSLLLWDKITVNGVKQVCNDLVIRRKKERELFLAA